MLPLLAQLVAPPLQPGPVRLPGTGQQQTRPAPPPQLRPTPETTPLPAAPSTTAAIPRLRGFNPYSSAELSRILGSCLSGKEPAAGLSNCAAVLSSRLFADGYINSRVIPQPDPLPGGLEVVAGKIEAIQVVSSSGRLQRRLQRLLAPLQGSVLRLPTLSATLNQIQQLPGMGLLKINLNRIGEDSSRALLLVTAEPGAQPLRGELALRNDGNAGSGQFRGLATLVQNSALLKGDSLLLFGELNADSDPELGSLNGSLSYTLPLLDQFSLTTAFGASRRNLVEAPQPFHDLSFRQLQLFSQLDITLYESLQNRWSAFVGLSANRNDAFLGGESVPVIVGGGDQGWLRSGFARLGLGYNRAAGPLAFNASLYGLQGIGAISTAAQLQELNFLGIVPNQSRAISSQLATFWQLAPRWQLELRAAGQLAFAPLTNPMGFSLGSDNGLRGLPGQVVSGDSGLLGSAELAWLLWRGTRDALQLVPFMGAGRVWTEVPGATFSESAGAGGVLLRWSRGRHGELELGWVRQFQSGSWAYWDQWILGSGFYTKVAYRF
ncbi:ShlB/FhaC/HecB family hemolysin secretion/activation protein [Vulcanococcus limneticus]|uniref:ShlB/FhaC/HecB family hemolysin secretion/activation protein n=1 Tax=Vulcanococcus limneticus TaxID=2170428 RepID=UPI00398C0A20